MTRLSDMIPVSEPRDGAEVLSRIKETRARLAETERRAKAQMQLAARVELTRRMIAHADALQRRRERSSAAMLAAIDAHRESINGLKAVEAEGADTPRAFLRRWCRDRSIDMADLTGKSQRREDVAVRLYALKAVIDAFPGIGTPTLGRLFGRDHTTIFHHIRKAGLR